MSLISALWWLLIAWWLASGFKAAREVWQQHPENPSRILLADFSGLLIFLSICMLFLPHSCHEVIDNESGDTIGFINIEAGFGSVKRGDIVAISFDELSYNHFDSHLIAVPNDRISVKGGILHINGVQFDSEPITFPKFEDDCGTAIVPKNHIVVLGWFGLKPSHPISCQQVYTVPIERLISHCLFVFWPLSKNCQLPTHEIPESGL
jgi:hypothetical protein